MYTPTNCATVPVAERNFPHDAAPSFQDNGTKHMKYSSWHRAVCVSFLTLVSRNSRGICEGSACPVPGPETLLETWRCQACSCQRQACLEASWENVYQPCRAAHLFTLPHSPVCVSSRWRPKNADEIPMKKFYEKKEDMVDIAPRLPSPDSLLLFSIINGIHAYCRKFETYRNVIRRKTNQH